MSDSNPHYTTAADVFDGWRDDVLTGSPPMLWPVGSGELARLEIGPGLVTLIGGAPGAGKTAFAMQLTTDALRLTPTLRALVCNLEMPPRVLYRDTKDGTARTSQADMARRTGTSERTIRRALDRLKRRGLLKVTCRGGFRRGMSRHRVCA